jgi:hypothetical protein
LNQILKQQQKGNSKAGIGMNIISNSGNNANNSN